LDFLFVWENFKCYVYQSALKRRNENDFLPGINEFTLEIVSTLPQLNDLAHKGFDLSPHFAMAKQMLEQGAVACLAFIGKELASMEWAATTSQAKVSIDIYPCKVDFLTRKLTPAVFGRIQNIGGMVCMSISTTGSTIFSGKTE
jgi:hypothetical protein